MPAGQVTRPRRWKSAPTELKILSFHEHHPPVHRAVKGNNQQRLQPLARQSALAYVPKAAG